MAARRRGLELLCPDRYCPGGVTDVTASWLVERGISAVLLDLDNTLVGWQRHDVPQEIIEWIESLRNAGISLYLVSNTRFGRRLESLSRRLNIPFVRRAWKPRRRGFRAAMGSLGVSPEQTAMIGDQMFTDVLGANRLGILSIMVRPMARREFIGTKVSRALEMLMLAYFRWRGLLVETPCVSESS